MAGLAADLPTPLPSLDIRGGVALSGRRRELPGRGEVLPYWMRHSIATRRRPRTLNISLSFPEDGFHTDDPQLQGQLDSIAELQETAIYLDVPNTGDGVALRL